MNKLLVLICASCLATTVYAIWQLQDTESQVLQLRQELSRMEQHATELEKEILRLQEKNLALQEQTPAGLLEQGKKGLAEKWDAIAEQLIDEMEGLTEEFKERLEEELPEEEPSENDDGQRI